ncbi:MAG: BMP family ABC transporter substrate-binding protein, partial [Candidatus Limnocylindria bacterium]
VETGDEPPTPGDPPYLGLQHFDVDDRERFFGRRRLTEQIVERVRGMRFLAIVGASGSGKSSLARAGLVADLQGDAQPGWLVRVLTPTAHPLQALALAMTRGNESVTATETLENDLRQSPRSLQLAAIRLVEAEGGRRSRVLVLVDQLEEVFTLCRNEAEAARFIECLIEAATAPDGPVTVVVTLRADFYASCAAYPALRRAIAQDQEFIGLLSPAELREAIEEPARRGAWEFAPGLVDLILHDVGEEPGALPLLSHALLETWRRRRGATMTLKSYWESGGVGGAIARTADRVYEQGLTPDQQVIARSIFLRLTQLGEGTQETRRRVDREELVPVAADGQEQLDAVLARLVGARLVTVSEGYVEVAHEALIREWPALRGWLDADREGLRIHRHLTESAGSWVSSGKDPGELYRGARLAAASALSQDGILDLMAREQEFLTASLDQQEAELDEERRRAETQRGLERRARVRLVALGIAILVLAGAAAYAAWAVGEAQVPRVGLVRTEGAFDASVEDGFDRAVADFGFAGREVSFVESQGSTNELSRLAEQDMDMIIVTGGLSDPEAILRANPDTQFILPFPVDEPNASLGVFDEPDGAFLVGAAAALTSETGVIGFIGGYDDWFIWRFQAGYEAGARAVKPDIRVVAVYLSAPPAGTAFRDPLLAQEAATEMYADGADVIFHAAGDAGIGLFEAAARMSTPDRQLWAIGVDSDQAQTVARLAGVIDPDAWRQHILTSMIKRQDRVAYQLLEDFAGGEFRSGVHLFSLDSGAVDISYTGGFIDDHRPRIEELRAAIIDGHIDVPCIPESRADAALALGISQDSCLPQQ